MDVHGLASTASTAGHLALAVLAFSARRRTRLAGVVGLTSVVLAAWIFAESMQRRTRVALWDHTAQACSMFAVALATNITARFVGRAREWALWQALCWTAATLLAFVSLLEPYISAVRGWPGTFSWGLTVGAFGGGTILCCIVALVAYRARQRDALERSRAALLASALAVNAASALVELSRSLGLPPPYLMPLGVFGGTLLTAAVVLETASADGGRPSVIEALISAAFGAVAIAVIHTIFVFTGHHLAMLALAVSCSLVLGFGASRPILRERQRRSERAARHELLGRMVEQLAHDLKNPLAALLGAIQVIEGQIVSKGSIERGNKMFQLLRPQAERIGAVLDRYLQVAQISPQRTVDDLGPIVRDAVAAVEAEARKDVLVELELDATLPRANIDRDLIRSALDNLTRNALQAMPNGGTLTIRALRDEDRDLLRAVALEVRDTGHGMDPRVLERAGEEFFSTRPDGSGLGLSFAQRVATAHGGKLKIESTLGEGTTVRMILPST